MLVGIVGGGVGAGQRIMGEWRDHNFVEMTRL